MGEQQRATTDALPSAAAETARGVCHVFFAFDVAHEIDLERCERRLRDPASRVRIAHRQRAPASFQFELAPLRVTQEIAPPSVGGHLLLPRVDAVLYDFGAVSLGYAVPFDGPLEALVALSCALHESESLREEARTRVAQLLQAIGDAAGRARLSDVTEDYLVFALERPRAADAREPLPPARAAALARVLRAERGELSAQEVRDALAEGVSYGPDDVCLVDWNGAIVVAVDAADAEDVRAVLEFANVQLTEMRFLDRRLDESLDRAYASVSARRGRAWLRSGERELTQVAGMQMEGAILFERVSNALKLLGDPYLARVYRRAAERFRLSEWNAGILRKLEAIESLYQKLSDAASARRMELLEWIIVLLIAFEIALSLLSRIGV